MLIKGILSFPCLFTPKVAKGATDPKYSCGVLLPPGDPQIPAIQAEVDAAKLNSFPSGYTGADECFGPYDVRYHGKEYYDPRFSGWHLFTCSAKADDRPAVVDMAHVAVIDPSNVYSGMIGYVNAGISGYIKGKGGIGGWLNGVMVTEEEPPMGRLDGRPSVEQMFANAGVAAAAGSGATTAAPPATHVMLPAANGATYEAMTAAGWSDQQMIDGGMMRRPPAPEAPAAPAAPTPPPVPNQTAAHVMTPKANGATFEAMVAAGWTEEVMIAQGMMLPPGGVMPSFA